MFFETKYGLKNENVQLFEIVNFLEINEKPVVVTTNLSPKELAKPECLTCKRIYDRLLGRCVMMVLMGEDLREKRQENGWKKNEF